MSILKVLVLPEPLLTNCTLDNKALHIYKDNNNKHNFLISWLLK